jgi:hypothetical protein
MRKYTMPLTVFSFGNLPWWWYNVTLTQPYYFVLQQDVEQLVTLRYVQGELDLFPLAWTRPKKRTSEQLVLGRVHPFSYADLHILLARRSFVHPIDIGFILGTHLESAMSFAFFSMILMSHGPLQHLINVYEFLPFHLVP